MGRAVVAFAPLEACIAPLDSIGADPQGGGFQVTSSSNLPSPGPKVHDVNNWVLPLSSWRQPRAMVKFFIVLGISWTTLRFPMPDTSSP